MPRPTSTASSLATDTGARAPTTRSAAPGGTSRRVPAPASTTANEVRILAGRWRRTPLPVIAVDGLRPTPSRVRETLFNWLGQDLTGQRWVDAFAGSGALGLEAASRGAAEVLLVEQDARVAARLGQTLGRLKAVGVRVERSDGLSVLSRCAGQGWDGVFLDPPFLGGGNDAMCRAAMAAAARAVAPEGWTYLESPRPWADDELAALGWRAHRRGRAGGVHYALFRLVAV
jgi:16S rRNA (guanine966-N2)-methyltransferase